MTTASLKIRSILLGGAALLAGLVCGPTEGSAQGNAPQLPNDSVIRFGGANTVGIGMIPPLANAWAKRLRLPAVRTEQGADPLEYTMLAEGAESARKVRLEVKFHGTPTGVEPMVRGQADFWMSVRPARESDLEAVRKRNVPNVPSLQQVLAPGAENVIALDGIAVVVHPSNPVRKMSFAQMKDIFTGKVTNWSQVGGADLPINVYAPSTSFGTFEKVCTTVIGAANSQQCVQQMVKLAAPHFASVDDLSDTVAGNPAGIGWVGLVAKRSARSVTIVTECGGTQEADPFYVKAEEYPLSSRYYLYTMPGRQLSPAARDFLNFTLAPEGQAALSAAGAVDLQPSLASEGYAADRLDNASNALDGGRTRIRPSDVRIFEEATQNANRLSITFRFLEGTDNLDARAEADLGRLAAMMQMADYAKAQLVLIGYSAARGDYASNRALSRDRANAVRDRLVNTLGVKNAVAFGVGPASPVACNTEGSTSASMNQRVEAWIRKTPGG